MSNFEQTKPSETAAFRLAFSIIEVTNITGVGRSFIYAEIKMGRLAVRKAGRRTLILETDLRDWLASLPEKHSGDKQDKLKPKTQT